MKRYLLPLTALSLLLGACSSFRPSIETASLPDGLPSPSGTKVTVWGELPSYEPSIHYFQNLQRANLVEPFRGHVVLDLKVDADGWVKDTSIFESSGNDAVDRAMLNVHKKARYTLRLGPDHPAPHVVRYKVVVSSSGRPPAGLSSNVDQTNPNGLGGPRAPTQGYSTSRP